MTSGTTSSRQRRAYAPRVPAEQRRAQLLDAALHLVVTRGHAAATIDAIAEQAGVTKPVVYGMFANRGALMAALLQREQEAALEQVLRIVPTEWIDGAAGDFAEALGGAAERFLEAVREAPERWHCVVMPMADMPIEFHLAREQARSVVLGRLAKLIRRMLADALSDLDPEIVAHSVVTLSEMAARLVLTDPDRFQPARFVTSLRAVAGLLNP